MSVNWDAVHKLLSIAHIAHQWPKLRPLNDAVLRELEVHADAAEKDNTAAMKKKKAEEEAAAKEKADAARAKVEEESKDIPKDEPNKPAPLPQPSILRRNLEEASNVE